jgi:hypothetical protein
MAIVITAFEQSPDRGRGLARDMRVRWALEEVSQPYEVRLLSFEAMKEAGHLAIHPFGQIPTLEDGDLTLFESGIFVASNTGYLTYGQHDLTSQDYAWRDHVTHTRSNSFGGW